MASHTGASDFEEVPAAARVITTGVSLAALAIVVFCLTRRITNVKNWRNLSVTAWLILVLYVISALYIVTSTMVTKNFSPDHSEGLCDATFFICLILYFSSRCMLYAFFTEKVRIVRSPLIPRLKDRLWVFNMTGVLGVYLAFITINIFYRVSYINANGQCMLGMKRAFIIPGDIVDVGVNIYLTVLFVQPVRGLHSFASGGNPALREMVKRTFIGMILTILATCLNVTVMAILERERAWLCIMLCTLDVTFTVITLQWVSSVDKNSGASSEGSRDILGISDHSSRVLKPISGGVADPNELPDFEILGDEPEMTIRPTAHACPRSFINPIIPEIDDVGETDEKKEMHVSTRLESTGSDPEE